MGQRDEVEMDWLLLALKEQLSASGFVLTGDGKSAAANVSSGRVNLVDKTFMHACKRLGHCK